MQSSYQKEAPLIITIMERERVFRGTRKQRGYGLGFFFAKLMRGALPIFKSSGKYLAKKVTKTGVNTLRDVIGGVNPRVAIKRRIADVSDEMLDDVKRKIRRKMTGSGVARKMIKGKKKKKIVKRRVKKKEIDVFDF